MTVKMYLTLVFMVILLALSYMAKNDLLKSLLACVSITLGLLFIKQKLKNATGESIKPMNRQMKIHREDMTSDITQDMNRIFKGNRKILDLSKENV